MLGLYRLSQELGWICYDADSSGRPVGRKENLTPRELEVLKLICEGYSSKEIAAKLKIAPKTATVHRANILGKAGVRNAVRLLRWAIKQGYVEVELPGEQPSASGAAKPAS
jgi:DNA-binding CsgD family transcriptional regulator